MPRKRTADAAELDVALEPVAAVPAEQQAVLARLRNMWEFASLMQYIFLFGHVVKIDDDMDIEVCECERTRRVFDAYLSTNTCICASRRMLMKFPWQDLEAECLKTEPSQRLASIGLQLLKYVSSHRGLT